MSNAPDIDVVYVWADGSDPAFAASLLGCRTSYLALHGRPPDPESIGANRFRDAGNLRYSLRSIEKNAPWFRRIFLVTNGQRPKWLTQDSRVEIVDVDAIFPDRLNLPTFNATAIEWNIHRIPGLSRYYCFMNDDYFFVRPTSPQYFFGKNGLPKLFLSPTPINLEPAGTALWDRMLSHQAKLLSERFGPRDWSQISHAPVVFDRVDLSRIRSLWPELIEQTNQHRFRSESDLHMQVLYANALAALDEVSDPAQRHETAVLSGDQLRFISVGNPSSPWRNKLRKAARKPSRFLCLNDDGPSEDFEEIGNIQRDFLQRLFPKPSAFEEKKTAGIGNTLRQALGQTYRMGMRRLGRRARSGAGIADAFQQVD